MTKNEINTIIVGLSKPGKMPCRGYSIPDQACKTGSKLRKIPGSICNGCYAYKGNYAFSNVKTALQKRLESIKGKHWVTAMVAAIGNDKFFRWHDSGDIQNLTHLRKIVKICELTPHCNHWLPTKEKAILKAFLKTDTLPQNLTVRLSAYMIDGKPPKTPKGILTSTTHHKLEPHGKACPAYKQGGKCHDCRACWDKSVINVSYPKH